MYRKGDKHRVGNLKLSGLTVNMTVIVGGVLPREHINSCEQAKWPLQINYGMYFSGKMSEC